ncbi:hypothetical protein V6N11_008586 [Hibiscus sabdariffa]|uniref:Uncharacterized protein n=1 Tax=Hibiscus sabdariffa TaxID=183260 RepID=A0ABR2PNT7_9ROSI
MCIPAEPPATVNDKIPPASWPSLGRIKLQELKALEKRQLKETISSLPNKLDSSAKASIDTTMDATLQQIIRQEFSECTVITVAHRVPTVIDSEMVMVLSYGDAF